MKCFSQSVCETYRCKQLDFYFVHDLFGFFYDPDPSKFLVIEIEWNFVGRGRAGCRQSIWCRDLLRCFAQELDGCLPGSTWRTPARWAPRRWREPRLRLGAATMAQCGAVEVRHDGDVLEVGVVRRFGAARPAGDFGAAWLAGGEDADHLEPSRSCARPTQCRERSLPLPSLCLTVRLFSFCKNGKEFAAQLHGRLGTEIHRWAEIPCSLLGSFQFDFFFIFFTCSFPCLLFQEF